MEFVDPRRTPFVGLKSRGELPHLYKPGACYFVSFRLADAIVPRAERPMPATIGPLNELGPQDLMKDFEPPLRLGSCWLAKAPIAGLVQDALLHFNRTRYQLMAWCVMPNHVHVIVTPLSGHALSSILNSWKGFTGKKANEFLKRHGAFWERESFDHAIRSAESVERFAEYVEQNPVEAGLCARAENWPYSSAGVRFESPLGQR